MKVWVVEENYTDDDDGNWATEIIAVHRTKQGAQANQEPDYETSGHMQGSRERCYYEMELLP
jgi:hypothetical protein